MILKTIKTFNTLQSLEIDKVRKNLDLLLGANLPAVQRSSINDEMTIFDYNHLSVRNYKEWTALTRCRELKKGLFHSKTNTSDEFNQKNV